MKRISTLLVIALALTFLSGLTVSAHDPIPVDGASCDAVDEQGTSENLPFDPSHQTVHHPHISLTTAADPQAYSAAEDEITYTFEVANTGNVTLTNVMLRDLNFTGMGILLHPVFVGATMGSFEGVLKPGEVATYIATYIVAEADLAAGYLKSSATAMGTAPDGNVVAATDDETVRAVLGGQDPQLNPVRGIAPPITLPVLPGPPLLGAADAVRAPETHQ